MKRKCNICNEYKDQSEFYPRHSNMEIRKPSDLYVYCKKCQLLKQSTPEALEKRRIKLKKWREKNPTKAAMYVKVYRERHPEKYKEHYIKMNEKFRYDLVSKIYNAAKVRAKKKGVPFDISKLDISIPRYCPILGIELKMGKEYARDYSPSLDKINPELGYIKGNIMIISHKANTMKSNATFSDIEKLYNFYKKLEIQYDLALD